MDPQRFDRLTRLVGSGQSRRGVLKALAGGMLAAVAGALGGEAEAARLRSVGNSCTVNSDCASGRCVQESRTRKICHCQSAADCPVAKDVCHSVACLPSGSCGLSVNLGAPCDDRNACTANDACQADGSCHGAPIACPTPDQCHVAGTCDPANGLCSNPVLPDGSACGSGQHCCHGVCCPHASDLCLAAGCCTPDAAATTCAGMCGTVANNCGQAVDCTALCPGCCSGGVCESGATDAACGSGGHACVACSTSDPVCGGHCSATFHICSYAGSHTSCGHNACSDGTVTYAGACDGAGACQPGASFSCAPYQCNDTGTACLGDCGADTDCVSGYYCGGIECVPAQANGAACDHGRQCASGNCVDGVCCVSASCGSCESCAAGNGSCASTCGSGQVCCNGACKVHGGYPCSGDSDCCVADGYGCPSTFCCTFNCSPYSPPDTVCCSAGNIG